MPTCNSAYPEHDWGKMEYQDGTYEITTLTKKGFYYQVCKHCNWVRVII